MTDVGQKERDTQNRIVKLFTDGMHYHYLGNWKNRSGNSNIEKELLSEFLKSNTSSTTVIDKVLFELERVSSDESLALYDLNKQLYSMIRYGVNIKESAGVTSETVQLIDWNSPENNSFYIAEEVTIKGKYDRRPDIVLYVNGIAVAILELKNSAVSVENGIRQNLSSQKDDFIRNFFGTIQLVMAGNDSEGLRYGTTETSEKFFMRWKEGEEGSGDLDRDLNLLCNRDRILEIIRYFVAFDSGTKKICRHNQYFGVKASQKSLMDKKGGIIWHTQGSGKSLTMIWLAAWIQENLHDPRVLIITDREELDGQIERFFKAVGQDIYRTRSGRDLIVQLNSPKEWLVCSLIHKFRSAQEPDIEAYIEDLETSIPNDFKPKGNIYVFVDECHRSQSNILHEAMKKLLPDSVFLGFTGTPLLKSDKKRSIEVFGPYIHTYKYDEAVRDEVVLDLQYEARNIDQNLTSPEKINMWFDANTTGLNDYAKAELKRRWGTMQKILSSKPRLNVIVSDIRLDMATKDRLASGRGNAILVADDILDACRYYELFQESGLKQCAIVTSYVSDPRATKMDTVDLNVDSENEVKQKVYSKMLNGRQQDKFEDEVKKKFIDEPDQMKLLIVVDKLLTGFDAPPASYLYIDKSMHDHGLFQAICRVNRIDSEDKKYGYIIDYMDLFNSLNKAVKDYTSDAFDDFDPDDVKGLLQDRVETGKRDLEESLEQLKALCEPVAPPKTLNSHIEFFCGDTGNPDDIRKNEEKRIKLYKLTSKLVRAFSDIANDMEKAGYTKEESEKKKADVAYFEHLRTDIKLASGDYLDLKVYEPAMRHLIDTYISATDSKVISSFDDLSIVDLVARDGPDAISRLPQSLRNDRSAAAETIENNVRKIIVKNRLTNPKYFEKMSTLLDEIIRERKNQSIDYEIYLKKIAELARNIKNLTGTSYPTSINTGAKMALYDNLGNNEGLAIAIDRCVREKAADSWRGNLIKENGLKLALKREVAKFDVTQDSDLERIMDLVRNRHEY